MDVFEHLLRASPPRADVPSLDVWLERLTQCPFEEPFDRALWSGFEADRLGYAFVGGYRAALSRLFMRQSSKLGTMVERRYAWPSREAHLSLAATEAGGAHPGAIETVLAEAGGALVLRGEKTFATLASVADELLVVASRGRGLDGKNLLTLVRVRRDAQGLSIEDRPPTPFAPEIPHAHVKLADVAVSSEDILPGDGYAAYLKPFRTLEDTYVLAATLAYVIGTARGHSFDPAVSETAIALAVTLRALTARQPGDPVWHVALAGVFAATHRLIDAHADEWSKAPSAARERWQRDQPLLLVASQARRQRTASAWRALASSADPAATGGPASTG